MTISTIPNRVEILKQKFTNSLGLPFRDLLPESTIREALEAENITYRRRLFDRFVTLWVFLSQVLDTDKSCTNAVSRVIAWLAAENTPIASSDTSAYCQARKRLAEKLLQQLFGRVAHNLEQLATSVGLWCGRHVLVIDGTTVSMPDTSLNQLAFPQPTNQSPGCGFPIAKIGAIFSLTTGAAVAIVIDVLNTHDVKLARLLYQFLNPSDILLGDCAFCSYADLVFIQNYALDAVFRLSQTRKNQIERGRSKPLSSFESIEVWHKPSTRPKGLSQDEFTSLPKTLTVRVIKYYIPSPGYRTKYVTLVTTLLDPKVYPTTEIMRLYGRRWDVELDLKHLKTTLGMDILRGKTPEMVRKEIYAHLLAYNLLRTVMWEAATTHQVDHVLLKIVVHKLVTERLGRCEPRVRKRRPKSYPLMMKPRQILRQECFAANAFR